MYICIYNICNIIYVIITNEKEAMDLKKSREGYMENDIIIIPKTYQKEIIKKPAL